MNLKIPGTVFFCLSPFQIFKKAYLQTCKYLGQFFRLCPFQIFKKNILTNLKIPETGFLLIPFFKYLKKHTYEPENTWDSF